MTHMFEVAEAKPYHVGRMIRAMRPDLRAEMIRIGLSPHHELRDTFARSAFRKAWLVDGRPVALGGVTGTLLSGAGFVWLVFAVEALRHPKALLVEARRQLDKLLETRDELTTKIPVADKASVRFAVRLGFRPVPFSNDGGMMQMVLRRVMTLSQLDAELVADRPAPFIVYGLPRSRTAWLARFLGGHHDLPMALDTPGQIIDALSRPGAGTVETGLTLAWPWLDRTFPAARIVVIRRPVADVQASLARQGWDFLPGELEGHDRRLDEIAALPNAIAVTSEELSTEAGCRRVFEHCRRGPMPIEHWRVLVDENIQVDPAWRESVMQARGAAIQSLFLRILKRAAPITIQTERLRQFRVDGQALFDAHYAEAGSYEGMPLDVNWAMFEALDASGQLVVTTARVLGILVGYLVFFTGPSLENKAILVGYQNVFFVVKEFRGTLGRRLHQAARAELRRRGVGQLILRSGVRAAGPKQAKYFERLGAKYLGTVYSLLLAE
jgi:hypothetical protein